MITLEMQLKVLVSYEDICELEEDGIIQILDHTTGAHYRKDNMDTILCGGVPVGRTWEQLLKWEVYEIELNSHNNQLEIYIKAPELDGWV